MSLTAWQRALLNTISGPESGGRYDVIYGGKRFSDFSRHPGINVPIQSGPNVGKTSSAAGKYQFIRPTWDHYQKKLGLKDFSPESQDLAAWNLAKDSYKGDLDAVLQSGDPTAIAGVGKALRGQWTSLPGGIEQGTNANKFVATFAKNLNNPALAQASASMPKAADPAAAQAAADVAAEMDTANQAVSSQLSANASLADVASPFEGMLAMMSGMDTPAPAPPPMEDSRKKRPPIDFEAVMEATSQTPDVYARLKRRRV